MGLGWTRIFLQKLEKACSNGHGHTHDDTFTNTIDGVFLRIDSGIKQEINGTLERS
jgi:hypothetical protein